MSKTPKSHDFDNFELSQSLKLRLLAAGRSPVIAIDGPSGSGKSSVARELASRLNLLYIDTGAMFRALAFLADRAGIAFEEAPRMQHFLAEVKLEYLGKAEKLILCEGEDLTQKIREHQVSKLASIISQLPSVRTFLLNYQHSLAKEDFCVMEGRDIGTVVFPQAFCKFFVTASVEIRAERRFKEVLAKGQGQGQKEVNLTQMIEDLRKRDETDMQRIMAPLKQAADALAVDTSGMNLVEVVDFIVLKIIQKTKQVT